MPSLTMEAIERYVLSGACCHALCALLLQWPCIFMQYPKLKGPCQVRRLLLQYSMACHVPIAQAACAAHHNLACQPSIRYVGEQRFRQWQSGSNSESNLVVESTPGMTAFRPPATRGVLGLKGQKLIEQDLCIACNLHIPLFLES